MANNNIDTVEQNPPQPNFSSTKIVKIAPDFFLALSLMLPWQPNTART